ncbi:MAG: hypothetical protein H6567_03950 [Lewinellaceae bacterium]|nr:hypothetical protein [Lewinellaceae bacterium]
MIIEDVLQFLLQMSMSKNQMLRDIQQLRPLLKPLKELLIPFSKEEIELLSISNNIQKKSNRFTPITLGFFTTIFHENVIAYATKQYRSNQSLTIICTSKDEFVYVEKDGTITTYFNDIATGFISADGALKTLKGETQAIIKGEDVRALHQVIVNGIEIGYLRNPRYGSKIQQRAFEWYVDMDESNLYWFLTLCLINLVQESFLPKLKSEDD